MSRQPLYEALDALSQAHGSKELAQAMRTVQRNVRKIRIADGKSISRLSAAVLDAWEIRDKLKADGVTGSELDAGLDVTLREVWPFTRTWHYICETCRDTGLQMFVCRRGLRCNGVSTRTDGPHEKPGKYRRLCAMDPDSDYEHEYGEACLCERGARFRDKPKPEPSEFTDAGKTPKRAGPTRFGR